MKVVMRSFTAILLLTGSLVALLHVSAVQAQGGCTDAPAPRLTPGEASRVVPGEGVGNNLRATPSSAGTVLGVMPEGEIFVVTSGPQCVEGFNWWQIRRWDGQAGFTSEGANGEYWLEPWPQDGATIPTVAAPTADAGLIAFISEDAQGSGMLTIMAPNETQISNMVTTERELGDVEAFDWSPDGARLVFTTVSEPSASLYVIGADGQNPLPLGTFATVTGPAWSPDGAKIVFAAAETGTDTPQITDLYTINADGTGLTNVSNTPDISEYEAVWSPDGTQIAFTSAENANTDVIAMDAGGFGAVVIAGSDALENQAAWSPDSGRIAYYADYADEPSALMIANDIGTSSARLADVYGGNRRTPPAFSPDGSRIAYVSGTGDDDTGANLFTITPNLSDPIQYTVDGAAAQPGWSPDGQWLTYVSAREGSMNIWVIRANGAGQARITDWDSGYNPAWSASTVTLPTAGATPAVTTVPGEAELLLIYDAGVPVFTLKNQSGEPLDLTPLSFSGAGVVVPATIWSTEFLASPLNAFKAGGCLQMWQFGLPQQDAPADCADSRQGWISEETGFFWTQGAFDVLYDGAVVATCETGAGRCEADLPIVQPVG